jgi:hypothetical protein
VNYHGRRWCIDKRFFWFLSFNPDIFEHLGEITFPITPLLSRQYQSLCISLQPILFPHLLIEKPSHILIVHSSQPLMHAAHHSYVVIIQYVHLLHIEEHRQIPLLIREKELCDGLWDEGHGDVGGLLGDNLFYIILILFHEGGPDEGVFNWLFRFGRGWGSLWFHGNTSLHEGLELGLEGFEGFESESEI